MRTDVDRDLEVLSGNSTIHHPQWRLNRVVNKDSGIWCGDLEELRPTIVGKWRHVWVKQDYVVGITEREMLTKAHQFIHSAEEEAKNPTPREVRYL